jgi:hypothetical protein
MEKTLLYLTLQKETENYYFVKWWRRQDNFFFTENNDAPGIVKAKSNIKTAFVDVIVKNRSQKAA